MSIRNFSKIFSKMVCREPIKMPRYIPFRNFSVINNPEGNNFNTKMNEPKKPTGSQESILFDKNITKQEENIKPVSDTFPKSDGSSVFEKAFSRSAESEGPSRQSQLNERGNYGTTISQEEVAHNLGNKVKPKLTEQLKAKPDFGGPDPTVTNKPNSISELNDKQSSPFQQHEPAASELTCRAKQLENLTKRDYQQCLDLCIQHPEKSADQIVEMIDKVKEQHKKAE